MSYKCIHCKYVDSEMDKNGRELPMEYGYMFTDSSSNLSRLNSSGHIHTARVIGCPKCKKIYVEFY